MTTSRSTASTSSWLAIVVVLCSLAGAADAGRKRVVVLDFEGPKGEKFHDGVVALVKAHHTVIPTEKWVSTADELDAAKSTDKNFKKIAKKLKIDAIVSGKIEKRRDEYIITIKLRGSDGEIVNNVNTKSESAKVDGGATRDLNAELVTAIDQIEKPSGGGDDDDAKPVKKPAKKPAASDDDDDAKPAKKGFTKHASDVADDDDDAKPKPVKKVIAKKTEDDDDDAKPAKKPVKKAADDDDDDAKPAKKAAKKPASDDGDDDDKPKKKKVAKGDDDSDGGETDKTDDDADPAAAALSPGNRALDLRAGLSFMARRMAFTYSSTLGSKAPPGYKGVPAPGLYIDGELFPGQISHKGEGIAKDVGVTVMVDKALLLSSQVTPPGGAATKLSTSMMQYAIGAVYRHAFGSDASAPVFEGNLRYIGQSFSISPTTAVTSAIIDVPDVSYSMIAPSVGIKYPAMPKLTVDATVGIQAVLSAGAITTMPEYGDASVFGFSGEIGGDYMVAKNLFIRAAFRFNTLAYTFKGTGVESMRGGTAQDVFGARDTYIGGAITAGYVY